MLGPNNFLTRSIDWIQLQTRKLFRSFSPEKQKRQNNEILKFPNLKHDKEAARHEGLRRAREKMAAQNQKQRTKQLKKEISEIWSRGKIQEQQGMELNCPICMDHMVGPVSTPCGHTFCWQCLDQAFLVNSVCPVCRLNIRKINFASSIELQTIILEFVSKINPESEEHYRHRMWLFQKWLQKRNLKIGSVHPSDIIDARDTEGIWCAAVIKNIVKTNEKYALLIHYIGWSNFYDEVIDIDSQRLATYRFYTGRSKLPRYQLVGQAQLQGYVLGLEEPQINPPELDDSIDSEQEIQIISESSNTSRSSQENDIALSSQQLEKCVEGDL